MPTYKFGYSPNPSDVIRVYATDYDKAVLAAKAKLDEEAKKPRSKLKGKSPWKLQLRDVEGL